MAEAFGSDAARGRNVVVSWEKEDRARGPGVRE